jgi:hypothetical protein
LAHQHKCNLTKEQRILTNFNKVLRVEAFLRVLEVRIDGCDFQIAGFSGSWVAAYSCGKPLA